MFLIIEDNLIDQIVIKQLLKKILEVTEINIANNGVEAIEWLSNYQNINQSLIILLDIQMPIMNGFEFLDAYNKFDEEFKRGIQIYILTSSMHPDDIKKINNDTNVVGFLNKPLQIEELKKQFLPNNV